MNAVKSWLPSRSSSLHNSSFSAVIFIPILAYHSFGCYIHIHYYYIKPNYAECNHDDYVLSQVIPCFILSLALLIQNISGDTGLVDANSPVDDSRAAVAAAARPCCLPKGNSKFFRLIFNSF